MKEYAAKEGLTDISGRIPWREVFPEQTKETLPGTLLSGYRYREGLTQDGLAKISGIQRWHISEMEHGKRPIGKENAKKLGQALGVDYRVLMWLWSSWTEKVCPQILCAVCLRRMLRL